MNLRRGMMDRIAFGALWAGWNGALWYQQFAAERTQIAALDECGKDTTLSAAAAGVCPHWTAAPFATAARVRRFPT